MELDQIAEAAHEVNRAFCEGMGDLSQPKWLDAPDWQKASAKNGVKAIRDGVVRAPEDSHKNWLAEKERDGWKYGPEKKPEAKEHPCMVPHSELPPEQQAKDVLFFTVVTALLRLAAKEAEAPKEEAGGEEAAPAAEE